MEMIGLLWWNTGNNIYFAEFHSAKHFRMYTEPSSYERMQNVMDNGVEIVFW
jgi:hypothetical protein